MLDPVPVMLTSCGLVTSLSLMVNTPLRCPVAVGLNWKLTLHAAPAFNVAVHVVVPSVKSPVRCACPESWQSYRYW